MLLGDQVYADELTERTRSLLHRLRDRRTEQRAPDDQVADYEEYTRLYYESWLDPEVRWLLSTIPSSMVFDDHELIDDWNTSAAWRATTTREPWWHGRITGGLVSYWVYQHLGNLSPQELAENAASAVDPGDGRGRRGPRRRADAAPDGRARRRRARHVPLELRAALGRRAADHGRQPGRPGAGGAAPPDARRG
ncbi:alkaline phosphatase D family protein [Blastococcus sp. TML/C7B]|uniref:alkaline phosphatase D family protein n=1 Tax=Blastococcus sp. TML/C7B TaxID=2798728 RepID=UPI002815563B|nr:alkaline phosphatase D family protein [Blastococcus sp. TML/C7B]